MNMTYIAMAATMNTSIWNLRSIAIGKTQNTEVYWYSIQNTKVCKLRSIMRKIFEVHAVTFSHFHSRVTVICYTGWPKVNDATLDFVCNTMHLRPTQFHDSWHGRNSSKRGSWQSQSTGTEVDEREFLFLIANRLRGHNHADTSIGVGAPSTLGERHFCTKIMYEKLAKCPNLTWFLFEKSSQYRNFWYLPEKLIKFLIARKMPEFYIKIARFFLGGVVGHVPPARVSYAYGQKIKTLQIRKTQPFRLPAKHA